MKMEALTSFMKDQPEIKKVYLINQNYSHGQQVAQVRQGDAWRASAPTCRSSATTCTRSARCKDFAPYIAKIKASGADTVITGNWGNDLSLLIKAAKDAGLNANFYTYYAGVSGTPTAHGRRRRRQGACPGGLRPQQHARRAAQAGRTTSRPSSTTTGTPLPTYNGLTHAGRGMAKAKSTDPVKVAAALEGLKFKGFNGEVEMRKTDHQLQQPLYITEWQQGRRQEPRTASRTPASTSGRSRPSRAYVASTPTSCQMKRP